MDCETSYDEYGIDSVYGSLIDVTEIVNALRKADEQLPAESRHISIYR